MDCESLRTNDSVDSLLESYSDMVYRIAVSMTKSRSVADDIYQEVFCKYFEKQRNFKSDDHQKHWLIRVTINMCKKYWNSSWFKKVVPLYDDICYENLEENSLKEYIDNLPKNYKTIIYLYYFEELNTKEIGSLLKISDSTVRMRLTRARRILKEKIGGDFFA